jgi:ATP-dependent helicase HepA
MVTHAKVPGVGRVGEIDGSRVKVDCFESIADPIAQSWWVEAAECRPAVLQRETRVYWQDADTGTWRTGRIVGGDPLEYFVRLPNSRYDFPASEASLRVRWDEPVKNPVDVLAVGANESGYYANTRMPMMRNLIAQRAACGSAFSLLSSRIEIFPHQVHAAMTVISDPVQRYLLADEVGLGKTVEAGLVIRQVLLDDPMSHIVVIAPDPLRRQWGDELLNNFFVGDFPLGQVKISSHETPEAWRRHHGCDLVVVDEAHLLVQVNEPTESPYRELADLAHSAQRVLLLSATPLTSRVNTHLGLLHLLDPDLYRWTEREAFEERFRLRRKLAAAVYGLDASEGYEAFLPAAVDDVAAVIPDDPRFQELAQTALSFLTEDGELGSEDTRLAFTAATEALRAHVSETYRLHRRMIRHRRDRVTLRKDDASTQPYELTGRSHPATLVPVFGRQQAVPDVLSDWQTGIADWLVDEGRVDEAPVYGLVLGVLVSRADGASSDLGDALRWRLKQDVGAADRAGLTDEERALLSGPPVVLTEQKALDQYGDGPFNEELDALAESIQSVLPGQQRGIVFCGAGALAGQLADSLRRKYPRLLTGEHTRRTKMELNDAAVTEWRKSGGILVVDDSAEEGLNLQAANVVVHLRLPWSPNRLEQRIGRVDRYQAGNTGQSARQYVLASPDGDYTLPDAWLALLDRGFDIFSQSVSTLQDTIDQHLADLWAAAVVSGPQGLNERIPVVAEDLRKELRAIAELDMLEESNDLQTGIVSIPAAIGELEMTWREVEVTTRNLASGPAGGLGFLEHEVGPGGQVIQFERGAKDPLVPPRILARGGAQLKPSMMRGAFNRTVALRSPGTRMLRSGNPFIDMLARAVWIDDRGQATAFLRQVPSEKHAYLYYGFDFLVEADIQAGLARAGDDPITRNALRRQADCLLAPFTRRIWVQGARKSAVEDALQVQWLDLPYKTKGKGFADINLNADKIDALLSRVGGRTGFTADARTALESATNELRRVTDLQSRCERAREQASSILTIRRAQAEARQAAGRLVTDTESYAGNVDIADALISGVSAPTVKVISVTCLVRGALAVVTSG